MEIDFFQADTPTICKNAFLAFTAKDINAAELEYYMLAEILKHIEEFCFVELPAEPELLTSFYGDKQSLAWTDKSPEEQRFIERRVYGNYKVAKYFEKLRKAVFVNMHGAGRLENSMDLWLDMGEKENARKCWALYNKYPNQLILGALQWKKKDYRHANS